MPPCGGLSHAALMTEQPQLEHGVHCGSQRQVESSQTGEKSHAHVPLSTPLPVSCVVAASVITTASPWAAESVVTAESVCPAESGTIAAS